MTYIKRITLKGFKSFSKETVIELDKGFSCIVGPNGSGKSNISDGILFVLGKLGSKGLRADTSSNLIYNGGMGGKPSTEAVVELALDNSEKTFPLEEKEIKIARMVRRKGSSLYKINDAIKTRQDVLDLLSKAGISPNGFNIILQAAISRFVEMKNEERRLLIEDISGISSYEEKKRKSLRELEKTDDKLKEIGIILKERGGYLENLEKERKQALLFQKTQEDIAVAKTALTLKQIGKKEYEKGNLNKSVEVEKNSFSKVSEEIKNMQKEVTELFDQISSTSKKIEEATGKEQVDLREVLIEIKGNIAGLEAKKGGIVDRIKNNLEREKQLSFDIEKGEESLIRIKKELREKPKKVDVKTLGSEILEDERRIISNIDKIVEKIKELRERKAEKQQIMNFLETIENVCLILRELFDKIKKNRDILSSPQKFESIRKLEIERGVIEGEISRITSLIKRNKEENTKLNSEIKEIDKEIGDESIREKSREGASKEFEKKFRDLFEKRNKLEKEVRNKEEIIKKKEERQWQIEGKLKQSEIEIARIEEDLINLEEELDPFKKFIDKAIVVKKSEIALKEEISKKQVKLEEFGSINLKALEVYDEAKKEFDEIVFKAEGLKEEKLEILKVIEEIDKKKKREFMKTFNKVGESFSDIFSKLAIKGQGFLELENKENPFEDGAGINIRIKMGKGKYLDTRSLSGGEKSMTAISFIFAIQEFKPHHFYLLDEVDAALDKRNSERLSLLIKNHIKKAQYISISHNDAMIGAADKLYGVSMQNGASKIVSLKL